MPTTLWYDNYAPDHVAQSAEEVEHWDVESGKPLAFTGLSAFDVPESIRIDVLPSANTVVFRFNYPGTEPPEPRLRSVTEDESLLLRLGQHTRTILEAHVRNASTALRKGIRFDPEVVSHWTGDLPSNAQRACDRNARLIAAVLSGIPSQFRKEIIRQLRNANEAP